MGNKEYLEKIATDLLNGECTLEKAERLTKNMKLEDTPEINENYKENLLIEDNFIKIYDEIEGESAYIEFKEDLDRSGKKFFWLEYAKSNDSERGHFSRLYNELENLAKKENAFYIQLCVDIDNVRAKSIYEHLGFYPIKPSKTYTGKWIEMRKDLSDSE